MYLRLLMISARAKILVRVGDQRLVHVQGDGVRALDIGPIDPALGQEDRPFAVNCLGNPVLRAAQVRHTVYIAGQIHHHSHPQGTKEAGILEQWNDGQTARNLPNIPTLQYSIRCLYAGRPAWACPRTSLSNRTSTRREEVSPPTAGR